MQHSLIYIDNITVKQYSVAGARCKLVPHTTVLDSQVFSERTSIFELSTLILHCDLPISIPLRLFPLFSIHLLALSDSDRSTFDASVFYLSMFGSFIAGPSFVDPFAGFVCTVFSHPT